MAQDQDLPDRSVNDDADDVRDTGRWIRRELDPTLLLPVHLQDVTFAEDIEARIRRQPFKSGFKKKWQENSDARELLNLAVTVAIEREKEVLLYHQARVFQHILWRSFEGVRSFLNMPLLPPFWIRAAKRPLSAAAVPSETPGGASQPAAAAASPMEQPRTPTVSQSVWKEWLTTALTPKGILAFAVVIVGVTTGLSYAKVQSYKEAIEAYQKNADAAAGLMKTVDQEKKATAEERSRKDADLSKAQADAFSHQSRFLEANAKVQTRDGEILQLRDQLKALQAENQRLLAKNTDINKQVLAERDENVKKANDARAEVIRLQADLKVLQEKHDAQSKRISEYDEQTQSNSKLVNKMREDLQKANAQVAQKQAEAAFLDFADIFANVIRRQVSYRSIDREEVRNALRDYDSAKRNILPSRAAANE